MEHRAFPCAGLGTSGFLLSCEGYTGNLWDSIKGVKPFELLGETWDCCRVTGRGIGPHRVDGGISWFFSRCGGKVGVPLELRWGKSGNLLPQGNQASFHVARGTLGFLFESLKGNRTSSRVEVGNMGYHCICNRILVYQVSTERNQASPGVEA